MPASESNHFVFLILKADDVYSVELDSTKRVDTNMHFAHTLEEINGLSKSQSYDDSKITPDPVLASHYLES